ncbi:MAG: NAD-dependent epimerase/dehydratase family protein [Alicyclobacillus sp.]|nr:NAD-dependent epimerase/dehydratase family protein [Alicyclobacillus sp.]
MIPIVLRAVLERRERVKIIGTVNDTPDRVCIRDYIHVLDLAYAHVTALEALENGRGSVVLNAGTGQGSSVREVMRTAEVLSGRSGEGGTEPPGDPPVRIRSPR